jgi:hypothetical protein
MPSLPLSLSTEAWAADSGTQRMDGWGTHLGVWALALAMLAQGEGGRNHSP